MTETGPHGDLLARRDEFPILATSTYLVNNSLGAMHRDSATELARYAAEWAEHGVVAWGHWIAEMARIGDQVAAIIGAPAGSVLLKQNVTDLVSAIASALDFGGSRNRVVMSDLEWPSSGYLWHEHQRFGAELVVVPSAGDGVHLDVQRIVEAIDERTLIVPISLVMFRSSTLVDVRPVIERAHEVGALVLLDAYQAAGALPVDVEALGADICVGGSVKYLCGGPGAGWLYMRPEVAERLRPAAVGWFGHARPFGFEFGPIEYAEGIARFTGGTHNVPSAYAASAGYQAVLDAGVERIRERSQWLTQRLLESALQRGWAVRSPLDPAQRGGHVTIDPGRSSEVHDALVARRIVVDHRPGAGIRVGPHFFTTAEEIDRVVDAIAEARAALG